MPEQNLVTWCQPGYQEFWSFLWRCSGWWLENRNEWGNWL